MPPREGSRLPLVAAAILVVAATLGTFWPSVHCDFVWDDQANYLAQQQRLQFDVESLRWMFTELRPHYMPLTWLSVSVDRALFDMDPWGWHLSNLLYHSGNALLLFWLLYGLAGDAGLRRRVWPALAGTLCFALHPLRVESVTWLTERRDLVAGMLCLVALLAYRRYGRSAGRAIGWYGAALLAFAASALLAKAIGLGLPVVLLALDAVPGRRLANGGWRRCLVEKVPFLLVAAGAAYLAVRGQQESDSLAMDRSAAALLEPGYRLAFYVGKTVWPTALSPLYLFDPGWPSVPWRAIWLAATALFSAGTLLVWRRRTWIPATWLAYVALLAPFLGLVQFSRHFAADRNTYLAGMVVGVWGMLAVAAPSRVAARRVVDVVGGLVLVVLAVLTWRQVPVWQDEAALWEHALALDPGNYVALYNRAILRDDAGDEDGALEDLRHAVERRPQYARAQLRLGNILERRNDVDGALAAYSRAIEGDPDYARAYFNRGNLRRFQKDFDGVLRDYDTAIRLDPGLTAAYLNRGIARAVTDQSEAALRDFDVVLAREPGSVEALANRGFALRKLNRLAEAEASLNEALARAPADWPGRAQVERMLARVRERLRGDGS